MTDFSTRAEKLLKDVWGVPNEPATPREIELIAEYFKSTYADGMEAGAQMVEEISSEHLAWPKTLADRIRLRAEEMRK